MCACAMNNLQFTNMFSVRNILYHGISFIAIGLTSFCVSECPSDAPGRVKQCTNILPNFEKNPQWKHSPPRPSAMMSMLKEECRSSRLLGVGKCISDILDQCKGTTDNEQFLQSLFDQENTVETVNYFCSNLPVYERNVRCINMQRERSVNCTAEERNSFIRMKQAGATMDVIIQATCSYHTVSLNCLLDLVSRSCDPSAAVFVERIILGSRPPACHEVKPRYKTVSYEGGNGQTRNRAGDFVQLLISVGLLCAMYH